ncbi:MASE1 domain-containing protein [Alicycliphilus denitrificans]|uniref:MASE1 domain-containing protein n=1 Tax=Alicycliphilus denitrificans TaxID=179636 RepID=UPI003850A1C6
MFTHVVPTAWRPLLQGMGLAAAWLGGLGLLVSTGGAGFGEALGLLHPTGGLVLALLLCRSGHDHLRFGAGLALGGLCMALWRPWTGEEGASVAELLAWGVEAGLGWRLLRRQGPEHAALPPFRQLLLHGGGWAAGSGALAWAGVMLVAGDWAVAEWVVRWLRWWAGSALGVMLIVPLILSWRQAWRAGVPPRQLAEGVLLYGLACAAGSVIFWGWGGPGLRPLAHAYWLFLFVVWAGVRLGVAGTMGLLCLVAAQAGWGMQQRQGFFAQDLQASGGLGYGAYVMILFLVGMALASYLQELRRQNAEARIAAIAFECQEGLLITDAQGVILRANQSLLAMSGYAAHEVLGRTPHFLRASSSGQGSEGPPPWPARQLRAWLRRKSGQRYPVWLTCTPVTNSRAQVTHHVFTLSDISDWRRQQALRRQREQAQRDVLVREVHHRIKNNLQGITGLLQTLGQRHPVLHEPLAEVAGQVHSVAVLHGLKGRSRADQVRLCELVQEVAEGVGALWCVAIAMQLPPPDAGASAYRIQPAEAVPLALILHELILNAVKHGGRTHQDVQVGIEVQQGRQAWLTISNRGRWPDAPPEGRVGLELVATLMPRSGAALALEQLGERAVARLSLQAPVLQWGRAASVLEKHEHES